MGSDIICLSSVQTLFIVYLLIPRLFRFCEEGKTLQTSLQNFCLCTISTVALQQLKQNWSSSNNNKKEWFVFKFMWHKAPAAQEMRERLALPWDLWKQVWDKSVTGLMLGNKKGPFLSVHSTISVCTGNLLAFPLHLKPPGVFYKPRNSFGASVQEFNFHIRCHLPSGQP